jgi:mycofactocin precursor
MTVTTTEETTPATTGDEAGAASAATPEVLVEGDLLVEDVSIDGMCGVY